MHFWIKSLAISAALAMIVACGDDDSDFTTRPSGESSSSIKSSSSKGATANDAICKTETEDNCEYDSLTDSRDDQVYRTVKIGEHWWMAENLNYETDNSFCYDDEDIYCTEFGRLYTWAAAMDSAGRWGSKGRNCGLDRVCTPEGNVRGVCPEGWHLPVTKEFFEIIKMAGGQSLAGEMMKFTDGWKDYGEKRGIGSDGFGFSALAAGIRGLFEHYLEIGSETYFWTATDSDSLRAYAMGLLNRNTNLEYYVLPKSEGVSVRCVKDE